MSLFRTLKILCEIWICFLVVYIYLLNRWLYTAVATFKKLGNNNFQLATNEIPLVLRTSTRPSHFCFSMGLPLKSSWGLCGSFVWPSRAEWAKGNFTESGQYLQGFLIWSRNYFPWSLGIHQSTPVPNLRAHEWKTLKSCTIATLPPLKSMSSSQSSQGPATDQCLDLLRIQS